MSKLWRVISEELSGLHLRLLLIQILLAPLPIHVGSRLRVYGLRLAGFSIGHSCVMWGTPRITGDRDLYRKLTIGQGCWFNMGCFFDLGAPITIGDRVAFGHQVMIMTNSHDVGAPHQRAAALYAKPVTIEDGAWLGARCTILPGVTIGAGAVVAAGAIVNKDVPPNTLVAGVPARAIKLLS
jgi:maltose O-acetyltransferase